MDLLSRRIETLPGRQLSLHSVPEDELLLEDEALLARWDLERRSQLKRAVQDVCVGTLVVHLVLAVLSAACR